MPENFTNYFGHNLQIIQLRLGKAKVCMVRSIPEGLGPKWGGGGKIRFPISK